MTFAMQPLLFTATLLMTACSGPFGASSGGSGGGTGLKKDLAELETAPPAKLPSLISGFGIERDYTAGFVAFYTGKRYFAGVVKEINSQEFQISGAIGTYDDSSGTTIVPHATRTTCIATYEAAKANKTKSSVVGTVTGSDILLTSGATSVDLPNLHLKPTVPSAGLVIEWGCFDAKTGNFISEAWSDIN